MARRALIAIAFLCGALSPGAFGLPPLTLARDRVTVRYHRDDELMAARVARLCEEDRAALQHQLGLRLTRRVEVILARGDAEFNRETATPVPKWALAIASPRRHRIVVRTWLVTPTALNNLAHTLRHETCHIVMAQAQRARPDRMPLWFHEGVAVWVSGARHIQPPHEMEIAKTQDALLPLSNLRESFPSDPAAAALAYQQSESIVRFMTTRFGDGLIAQIIQEYAGGTGFEECVATAAGMSLQEVERRWRGEHRVQFPWLRLVWKATSLFTALAVLCVVAYLFVRRRAKRLKEKWEREERILGVGPDDTSDANP